MLPQDTTDDLDQTRQRIREILRSGWAKFDALKKERVEIIARFLRHADDISIEQLKKKIYESR